jgi:hypothetical protein
MKRRPELGNLLSSVDTRDTLPFVDFAGLPTDKPFESLAEYCTVTLLSLSLVVQWT